VQLLDLLFPKQCLGCKKYGRYLCENCLAVPQVKQRCIVCQKPAVDGYTHPYCKGKYTIDRAIALYPYKSVVGKAIRSLKYKFATDIAKELSEIIISHSPISLTTQIPPNSLLVPIPMHWKRKNWRGFNQTEVIGEQVSNKLGLGYQPNILQRIKQPKAQEGLKKEERLSNVSNVFSLNLKSSILSEACNSVVNPKSIYILFDDVLTTGSTLSEAGKVLKKAGAQKVWAITIAR
jgi:competence protein ComFC